MPGSEEKARYLRRRVFVHDPDSERIAQELNGGFRIDQTCIHGREPCYLRCGVRRDPPGRPITLTFRERDEEGGRRRTEVEWIGGGPWVTIPYEERLAWLDRVEQLARRDRRKKAPVLDAEQGEEGEEDDAEGAAEYVV